MSEPLHVTDGVRHVGVLNLYLLAAYLDDLSFELKNIKAGIYIGEVLPSTHYDIEQTALRSLHTHETAQKYAQEKLHLCQLHELELVE